MVTKTDTRPVPTQDKAPSKRVNSVRQVSASVLGLRRDGGSRLAWWSW